MSDGKEKKVVTIIRTVLLEILKLYNTQLQFMYLYFVIIEVEIQIYMGKLLIVFLVCLLIGSTGR